MTLHKPVNPADSGQPATSGVSGKSGDASRHTSGPWTVNGFGGTFAVIARLRPHGVAISARANAKPEEEIPNARLIASAPELLLALGDLLTAEKFLDDDDPALVSVRERARQVIAKAEGRS